MDPVKAFAAAKEKLALAKEKLEAMRQATSVDQLAQLWAEFLVEQHRVYLRLRKATERGAAKGWFDKIIALQRTDDLLMYLLHARDAAEHGIDPITEKRHGGVGLRPRPGRTSVHIKRMRISGGPEGTRVEIDPETAAQVVIEFRPDSVHLSPVLDRGRVYQPPVRHHERPIDPPSPIAAAEMAIAFIESQMAEAGEKFFK